MNKSQFINSLKNKNIRAAVINQQQNKQSSTNQPENVSNQSNLSNQTVILQNIDDKYNPDVSKSYDNSLSNRKNTSYEHTNNIWKPIIGSVSKTNITVDDLVLNFEKPDHNKIKNIYEEQMQERLREMEIAKKMAEDYARANNLNKEIMEEIQKPIQLNEEEQKALSSIDNTFIELKNNAKDILTNKDSVDTNIIMESISKLDDLNNWIKNL